MTPNWASLGYFRNPHFHAAPQNGTQTGTDRRNGAPKRPRFHLLLTDQPPLRGFKHLEKPTSILPESQRAQNISTDTNPPAFM